MDYEKKYNEALERARKIREDILNNEIIGFPGQVTDIFPELCESEDERIRKYLIDFVGLSDNPRKGEMIAYLEKQKERGPLTKEEEYTLQRIIEYLEDETCPPEWISLLHDIYCLPYEKQKEQKPAWSEEELLFRGEKVTVKRPFYRDDKGRGYSTAELDEGFAWNALRAWCEKKGISLYDLYPKAEWSEEDEDMLNSCISSIEEAKENRYAYKETDGDTSYDHEIAWLKSIRPSWKPSEEQMKALRKAVNKLANTDVADSVRLSIMYDNLKKL